MSFSAGGCKRVAGEVRGTGVVCCSCWRMAGGADVEEAAACALGKDSDCRAWACLAGCVGA
jgi:hypothetical protein